MCHHVPNYLHRLITDYSTVLLNMADLEDLLDLLLMGVLLKLVSAGPTDPSAQVISQVLVDVAGRVYDWIRTSPARCARHLKEHWPPALQQFRGSFKGTGVNRNFRHLQEFQAFLKE